MEGCRSSFTATVGQERPTDGVFQRLVSKSGAGLEDWSYQVFPKGFEAYRCPLLSARRQMSRS